MIKVMVAIAVFFSITVLGQTGKIKVPSEVTSAFKKEFPGKTPQWSLEYRGANKDQARYEGKFGIDGSSAVAVYDKVGYLTAVEAEVKPANLPATVQKYLLVYYPTNPVQEAAKITDDKKVVTYEVGIQRDGAFIDLQFDSDGTFVQSLEKNN